jgi:hypothetical protein
VEIPAVWVIDRARWESPDGRFFFDMAAADRACEFFPELLRHHIGEFAGQPFELMDYQRVLLTRPIFGWKSDGDWPAAVPQGVRVHSERRGQVAVGGRHRPLPDRR